MITQGQNQDKGLGATGQAITSIAGSTATAFSVPIATSTGLTAAVGSASLAVPIVGAAIAGITTLIGFFMSGAAKYHAQESAATKVVDQAERYMIDNMRAWLSSPTKTLEEQQICLGNFDQLWQAMVNALSDPSLGDPGKRGITERAPGGKYDYTRRYRDPIANDPEAGRIGGNPMHLAGNIVGSLQEIASGMVSPASIKWLFILGTLGIIGLSIQGKN